MADHAENIVRCGLCEVQGNVNSYCKKCKEYICDNCKKAHSKTSKSHKVVFAIERFMLGKGEDTICLKHGECLQYHCKQCGKNICGICLKRDHVHHRYETVSDSARILRMKFDEDLAREQKHLVNFQINLKKVKKYQGEYSKDVQKQIAAVRAEAEIWRRKIDDKESKLIDMLKKEEKSAKNVLQYKCDTVQNLQNAQLKLLESIKNELKHTSDTSILSFINDSREKLKSSSANISFKVTKPPTFESASFEENGRELLGSLHYHGDAIFKFDTEIDNPEPYMPPSSPTIQSNIAKGITPLLKKDLSFVHRFTPREGRYVVSVCDSGDGLCWVGVWTGVYTGKDTGDILHINQHGSVRQTVHLPHNTNYTALATAGDLFVSGYGTSKITLVSRQGKSRLFVNVAARNVDYVVGLASTRQGDLFVCVRMAEDTKDRVIKLSAQGKKLLQLDEQMFQSSRLCGVHAVSGEMFCVQDGRGEDWESRLVFVDVGGQLVRHINRKAELKTNIQAFVWDVYGNMIAGSVGDEYVYFFCRDGTCKHSYRVVGSEAIHGLSLGEDNILWIGTEAGKVFVAKYIQHSYSRYSGEYNSTKTE